jgi:hypothetical protein
MISTYVLCRNSSARPMIPKRVRFLKFRLLTRVTLPLGPASIRPVRLLGHGRIFGLDSVTGYVGYQSVKIDEEYHIQVSAANPFVKSATSRDPATAINLHEGTHILAEIPQSRSCVLAVQASSIVNGRRKLHQFWQRIPTSFAGLQSVCVIGKDRTSQMAVASILRHYQARLAVFESMRKI